MKTTNRSYAEEAGDFNRLCHFVVACCAGGRARSPWPLGRVVDWKHGLYGNKMNIPGFCNNNARLWFDGFGELAGVAISEGGDAGFAIITAEGYRFLFEEILNWVLSNWNDRGPRFSTELTEVQTMEATILERFGFRASATFFTQRFDLAAAPTRRFALEPGFSIVDMQAHPNYREQSILRRDAFRGERSITEEALAQDLILGRYLHEGPTYHAPCDLCVMDEGGRFVAGCEAMIDARNAAADIERICTHSSFRRRGFARAVIQACLDRLREMGMRNTYITGYSPEAIALYGSMGAVDAFESFVYEYE